MPPTAAEVAMRTALEAKHGIYKNNRTTVVDPLVTYYSGRGEELSADIPL